MVYNEGHDMSQFCADVNHLLTNFPERLIKNGKLYFIVIIVEKNLLKIQMKLLMVSLYQKL